MALSTCYKNSAFGAKMERAFKTFKNLKDKRGITVRFLIIIIIAVISLAVIIAFLIKFPGREIIDKETCHQSVLMRSMPGIGEAMKRTVNLRCKTEDILINYKDKELIKERIANAMYDCWWMLGEGRLSPFLEGNLKEMGILPAKSACVICSKIEFSDRTRKKFTSIDITDYVQDIKIPGKEITYFEYFTDEEGTRLPIDVEIEAMATDKEYAIVFFGFESEELWGPITKDAGVAAGLLTGSLFMAGGHATGTMMKGLFGISHKTIKGVIGFGGTPTRTVLVGAGKFMIPVVLAFLAYQTGVSAWGQHIAAGYCDNEKKGCFQVMLVPYDVEQISHYCKNIESIP